MFQFLAHFVLVYIKKMTIVVKNSGSSNGGLNVVYSGIKLLVENDKI